MIFHTPTRLVLASAKAWAGLILAPLGTVSAIQIISALDHINLLPLQKEYVGKPPIRRSALKFVLSRPLSRLPRIEKIQRSSDSLVRAVIVRGTAFSNTF